MQKSTKIYNALALAGLLSLGACGGGGVELHTPAPPAPPAAAPVPSAVVLAVDFNAGIEGWTGGVADYHDGDKPSNMKYEQRALPAPLTGKAYYIASRNNSDDVFTYAKKQFGGFVPNTRYTVGVELRYASAAAIGCFGVGGSEGESVYVTAAVSAAEPILVEAADGRYRLNIDRGDQAVSGTVGQVMGVIGAEGLQCDNSLYGSSVRKTATPITVQTDAAGKFWLVLGIDSAFESASEIYLQSATVSAKPI